MNQGLSWGTSSLTYDPHVHRPHCLALGHRDQTLGQQHSVLCHSLFLFLCCLTCLCARPLLHKLETTSYWWRQWNVRVRSRVERSWIILTICEPWSGLWLHCRQHDSAPWRTVHGQTFMSQLLGLDKFELTFSAPGVENTYPREASWFTILPAITKAALILCAFDRVVN